MDFGQMLQTLYGNLRGAAPAPQSIPGSADVLLQQFMTPIDIGPARPAELRPPAMPTPQGVDTSAALDMLLSSMGTPNYTALPKDAPDRKAPQSLDLAPFVEQMKQNAPTDPRRSKEELDQDKWLALLGGMAGGTAGATSIGEALMGAGAGGAQAALQHKDRARAEEMAYEESMRQWNLDMVDLDMQAKQAEINALNATDEVEYANAMADHTAAIASIGELNRQAEVASEMRRQKAEAAFNVMQLDAQQATDVGMVDFQNRQLDYEADLRNAELESGKILGIVGNSAQIMRTVNGRTVIEQKPLGLAGELEAITSVIGNLSATQPELAAQILSGPLLYSMTEQQAPGSAKIMLMKNLISKGLVSEVFTSDRQELAALAKETGMTPKDLFEYQKSLPRIMQEAEAAQDKAMSSGATPEAAFTIGQNTMALGLVELYQKYPALRNRLEGLQEPSIAAGVPYLD